MTPLPKTKKLRVEQLLEQLRHDILNGSLKPRERLLEERIARKYGVSRSPIREAFRILESEGLLRIMPRKGVYVADIDEEDINAIYEIRPVLEEIAAKLACRNMTTKDIEDLSKIADDMGKAAEENHSYLYFELNRKFHEAIHEFSRNKYLIRILRTMSHQTYRNRYLSLVLFGGLKQSHKKHVKIVEAFRERNEKKVVRLRRKQIDASRKTIGNKILGERRLNPSGALIEL
jgi:DNA-binding GntR family transcriptional regulator